MTTIEDAVALLMEDHRRVKELFDRFGKLKAAGESQAKQAVVTQICEELTLHTLLEEEIFYPAVRAAIDEDDDMDEALVEHAGAKDLIAQLQAAEPGSDLYDAKVTVLGEQIEHHVLEEEGSMFSQARHADLDLVALKEEMLARKAQAQGRGQAQGQGRAPARKPGRAAAPPAARAKRTAAKRTAKPKKRGR